MHALVVYESMFGNTEALARAVAAGLAETVPVEVVEVGDASTFVDRHVGLLVAGAPTHAFGLSRPRTRSDAADRTGAALVSTGPGLREWAEAITGGPAGLPVACFDTRIRRPRLPGSAAKAALRRLRQHGFVPAARPTSFTVEGTLGPLSPGELDRARRWGAELAAAARPPLSRPSAA